MFAPSDTPFEDSMTDAHEPNEIDGPHEGPIKTPRQLILAVLYAFLVPIFGIVLLVMFVTTGDRPSAGSDAFTPKATDERIQPVGHVEVKDATDFASMKTGEQVFAAQCTTCHTAGLLGAPKFGDAAAWAPRIKTGFDALLHSALGGKGQMPPQGGGDFSDFEVARAVVYMANKGGANFPEPTAPAAAASGATADTAASAPVADANSGTPIATPTAGMNAQVQTAVPNAVPGRNDGRGRRGHDSRDADGERRAAGPLHAGLHGLPHRRCPGCAEARRQGRVGAAHRARHRCADRERHQGQGLDAAEGWFERQRGRHQGRRDLHGQRGEVASGFGSSR